MKNRLRILNSLFIILLLGVQCLFAQTLDPLSVPKFQNDLPVIRELGLRVDLPGGSNIDVSMEQTQQDLGLSTTPTLTTVWGYRFPGLPTTYPGATIVAYKDEQIQIQWNNNLPFTHLLPVDMSLHMAKPQNGIAVVTHLHGGHSESASDGLPEAWFTQGFAETGIDFVKPRYRYDNSQEGATIWYHDHALGITRLNVYAGLAGFYFLRDDNELNLIENHVLPAEPYEIEIVIQDRMFDENYQLYRPAEPEVDPDGIWCGDQFNPNPGNQCLPLPEPSTVAEFFGDIILVNGKAWPKLEVEPRKYRFRFLNGSDSRFYILKFNSGNYETFNVIGTDDGLLPTPVALTQLLFAPGERYDVIVDFASLNGNSIVLENWGPDEPFKGFNSDGTLNDGMGMELAPADPTTTGKLMQFNVSLPLNASYNEASVTSGTPLRPAITPLAPTAPTRKLALFEGLDAFGRLQPLLGTLDQGSLTWGDPITENPMLNDVEIWEIYNTTMDAHPMHLHLVSFQIVDRQPFDGAVNSKVITEHDGTFGLGAILDATTITLEGPATGPEAHESGWKDTAVMLPGQVTRVIAKFDRPGLYVWHCHILSHEDHEMMRPFRVMEGTLKEQYLMIADKKIEFDKYNMAVGELHSNGIVQFDKGGPSEFHGNVTSVSNVSISKLNTIHGDVTSGGKVTVASGAQVMGTITQYANVACIPLPVVPPVSFGNTNFSVPKNATRTLSPGKYKGVQVDKYGTLKMSAGTYNLKNLDFQKNGTLVIDAQLGPVTINIQEYLDVDKYGMMMLLNGTSQDVTFNIRGASVILDQSVNWQGSINAPTAYVKLLNGAKFKGSICGEKIYVEKYVEMLHHSASMNPHTPKWIAGDDEGQDTGEQTANLPTQYTLEQNYPNPFNPSTSIQFALPQSADVLLKIYNIRGQLVRTLASGNYEAGYHSVQWDATDDFGVKVASGIYIYRLQASDFMQNKKMLLIK